MSKVNVFEGEWKPYPENKPNDYEFVLATLNSPEEVWVEEVAYCDGKFILPGRGSTTFVTHWATKPKPAVTINQ